MLDSTGMILLAVTASISFVIGRVIMHWRKRKKAEQQLIVNERAAQALKEMPPEPPSNNKSKRKRQLQNTKRAQTDTSR